MKKICFVSFSNIYLCPYLHNYLKFAKNKVDILCWNRHDVVENIENHHLEAFNLPCPDNTKNKIKKINSYLKYSKWVKRKITNEKYDVIIFLQSIGSIFLNKTLLKEYKKKYIIDIRDYSVEGNKLLFSIEKKLLKNSLLNVISSKGYLNFLPNNCDYLLNHNHNSLNATEPFKKPNPPFKLAYIGLIRFQEQNKRIINLFGNDSRFIISFIGKNANELLPIVLENKYKNIELIDRFPPSQTIDFYKKNDGILNVYGNHDPLLDYALSNKLYFSALMKKPILVSKDTYMEEISTKYNFGFVLDFDDPCIKDKLYNYLSNLDERFVDGCEDFIKIVEKENEIFENAIRKVFE